MKAKSKLLTIILIILVISACNKKSEPIIENKNFDNTVLEKEKSIISIEGLYKTQPDPNSTNECEISVEISKVKNDYVYFLKTKLRKLKGKATITTNEAGDKYIVLEGIKWDNYEGYITNEDETDSISDSKSERIELEIDVGIDALYAKDTLTIQNYGNSMNSYTKISECGREYIQLIKK